jgi:ubiquinone/menaquinone biosynthesis C-methylase UbiE
MEHKSAELLHISSVTRSHPEARANYDALSRWYDMLEGGWERRPREKAIQRMSLPLDARVLEIGCGTGTSLAGLAEKAGMGSRICGADLSAGMLWVAKNRMRRQKISNPIVLCQADALTLPFSSASFQALFISFTLELFDTPEIPIILGECIRVLQPGAVLSLVATSRMGGIGWMTSLYEFFHRKFPRTVDCRPIYAASALEAAGFKILSAEVDSLWGIGLEIITARKS